MNENKLINKYLKKSYEELESIIKSKYDIVNNYLLSKNITQSHYFICGIILTCIASDAFYSANEWELINKILCKHSYNEAIDGMMLFVNESYRLKCIELIELLPKHIKEEMIEMCIIVFCIDNRVNKNELSFLNKMLNL